MARQRGRYGVEKYRHGSPCPPFTASLSSTGAIPETLPSTSSVIVGGEFKVSWICGRNGDPGIGSSGRRHGRAAMLPGRRERRGRYPVSGIPPGHQGVMEEMRFCSELEGLRPSQAPAGTAVAPYGPSQLENTSCFLELLPFRQSLL